MAITESLLKERIKAGTSPLYVLYGKESYLTEQYTHLIIKHTVEEGFDAFNLQQFDGQTVTVEELEDAVEALPVMSERKCVVVRDMDAAGKESDRLLRLISSLPESCVLVFRQMTLQPDRKKAWNAFLKQAEAVGTVMNFEPKTPAEAARLLVTGAKRRGCVLEPEDARYLAEQAGCDLHLLLGELDKLTAIAGEGGTVTRELIDRAAVKNLEARVFDLSKAILRRDAPAAYGLLHQLRVQREDPIAVMGVLSTAYSDLYRAKVAIAAGASPESLAADFKSYKGKEFRLRNAGRDARRLSVDTLRQCLAILARADTALKLTRSGDWAVPEEAVARLMTAAGEGGR